MIKTNKLDRVLKDDPLLTTREAGEASGLAANHFIFQIQSGNIEATKDEKGRWQMRQSELDRYLRTKTVKPQRKYDQKGPKEVPETSLLTQLDTTKKQNQILESEIAASKRIIEGMEISLADMARDYDAQIADNTKRLEARKNKIEQQKEEIEALKLENQTHTEFLRTTLSDLLKYVTK